MKEQSTTGVTSLFFLSFLLKNGYYAELRDRPFGYRGGGVRGGLGFYLKNILVLDMQEKNKMAQEGY